LYFISSRIRNSEHVRFGLVERTQLWSLTANGNILRRLHSTGPAGDVRVTSEAHFSSLPELTADFRVQKSLLWEKRWTCVQASLFADECGRSIGEGLRVAGRGLGGYCNHVCARYFNMGSIGLVGTDPEPGFCGVRSVHGYSAHRLRPRFFHLRRLTRRKRRLSETYWLCEMKHQSVEEYDISNRPFSTHEPAIGSNSP